MAQISKKVRDTARTVLADGTRGFNAAYASLVGTYGTPTMAIDFTNGSANFIQGQLTPDQADASGDYTYPTLVLFTAQSVNTNDRKFAQFAGRVEVGLDVWLSRLEDEVVQDTESWGDAIEDAMFGVLNGTFGTQSFTQAGLIYNGDLSLTRNPVTLAGENWLQVLSFRATFML